MNCLRVVMVGLHPNTTSGVANVVNNWLEAGMKDEIELKYISTLRNFVPGRYLIKFMDAIFAYALFVLKAQGSFDIVHIT